MPNVLMTRREILKTDRYLLRDEFWGNVINQYLWTLTDSEGKLSVANGVLSCAGGMAVPAWGDPALVSQRSFIRRAGLSCRFHINLNATNNRKMLGFGTDATTWNHVLYFSHLSGGQLWTGAASVVSPYTYAASTDYVGLIVVKAAGALYYISDDGGIIYKLVGEDSSDTTTPLKMILVSRDAALTSNYIRVFQSIPKPAIVSDTFTRADSALTLGSAETGQAWTAVSGTWGISSNKAYSASDADADLASISASKADGIMDSDVLGTLNSGVTYRVPECVFRLDDASNYLYVRMLNGAVSLRKNDADVHSELATAAQTTADNTSYTIRVVTLGNVIRVYVDGTSKIAYTLAGGDTKYAAYTVCGMRLAKAGSPATAATFDNWSFQGGLP